jgi:predicted ATPase/tRNA A-37 threonylcarbamoyl transferase component Bud32
LTLDAGTEVAGYRIEGLLGQGGMGIVYRAEHVVLGRKAALKTLLAEHAEDADFRERFVRESQLVAGLEHPNIVPIYDAGEADGVAYIAMRFVRGTDLSELVKAEGALPRDRLLSILDQTAAALDSAHAHDLVHRDVKPGNVLIDEDSDRAYLTDFGIAKHGRARGKTATGLFMGTVDYASPEQIEGKEVGPATDVYALGCVLFEGLTGRKPFEKDTDVAVVYGHLLEEPPSATELRPDLSHEIDAVIARALAKAADNRFSNCRQLVEAARTALGGSASGTFVAPAPILRMPVALRVRSNLPTPPTALVGREREVEELVALLQRADNRLVTLTGPGGTGKTRLALEVASSLGGEAVFVDLAPVHDPDLVGATIAHVLGAEEATGQSELESIAARIGDVELLLVLDNFEQLVDAAPFVASILETIPSVRLLVTSQSPLHLRGEHQYPLEPLDEAQAVALFVERAQAVKPGFALGEENAAAVAEIARRLDGLPLAIELAAARIKLLSPQAIAGRLENRLDLLTTGARDLPERQQTLRSAIDWSYELLDEGEQKVFARLGAFSGGCSLEAAEAVCGAQEGLRLGEVMDLLGSLVDKSLLRQIDAADGEPRFLLFETIREYARTRLVESGEAGTVQRAHAERYLALAEMAEPELIRAEQATWLQRLDEEQGNLRAALEWSLESGEIEVGLRIAAALGRFWSTRGHMAEGRKWLGAALASSPDVEERVLARAHFAAGYAAIGQADYDQAKPFFEECLAAAGKLHDSQLEGASLAQLAWIEMARAQEDAEELAVASLERARATGDKLTASGALNVLAELASARGDDARAKELFDEGLSLRRELGDQRLIANSLLNLARAELRSGKVERANRLLEQGLGLARQVGDTWAASVAVLNLGWAALHDGDRERAREAFEEALAIANIRGDKRVAAESLQGLALAGGDPSRGARLWGAGAALLEELGLAASTFEQALAERLLPGLQDELGAEAFAAAEAAGRTLSLEDAVAEASPAGT